MSHLLGSNLNDVKHQNRSTVLRILLRHGPLARSAIGRMTHLVPSTITNLTGELMAHGLVHEVTMPADVDHDRVGRPTVPLDISDRGGFVLGAYVGARYLTVALGDLRARPVDSIRRPMAPDLALTALIDQIVNDYQLLLARHGVESTRVFGLGVAAAGRVDPGRGLLVQLPHHPWRDAPIGSLLAARLPFPVAVEESRRAMALAEITFGRARDVANMVLVHCGTSIGCGLVIDHHVYTGAHFDAGMLGHVVVEPDGALCTCGNRGCLETIATDDSVVRLARATGWSMPPGSVPPRAADMGQTLPGDGSLEATSIIEAARDGDPVATRVVRHVATALGRALANLVLTMDPALVVVAGRPSAAGSVLLAPIGQTVDAIIGQALGRPVQIEPSAFGEEWPSMASLTLALDRFVYSSALRLPGDRVQEGGTSLPSARRRAR